MSIIQTRNFNDFQEIRMIIPESSGPEFILVIPDSNPNSGVIASLVSHFLANNNGKITDLFPIIDGSEKIEDIRTRCQTEHDEFGRPGAILIDETYGTASMTEGNSRLLASLANELGIKIVLLTPYATSAIIQDASLIVEVQAGEDSNHTLKVLKNRTGATGSIKFAYEDPIKV